MIASVNYNNKRKVYC